MYAVRLVCPDVLHLTAGKQPSATDWHKKTCIPHFHRSVKNATSIQAKVKYCLVTEKQLSFPPIPANDYDYIITSPEQFRFMETGTW
jgi:hypothetical protein